jgi:tRNA 5-methylaminomethyl-2-thiouridine biosynthesis bifunctional protein
LAEANWQVEVLEAADQLGAGASGLPVGLAAPHVSPDDHVLSRITRWGVQATLARCEALTAQGKLSADDWQASGVLEHRVKTKRSPPSGKALPTEGESWSLRASTQQLVAAGFAVETPALWHAKAAWIRPQRLVQAQLATTGIHLRLACHVHRISYNDGQWTVWNDQGECLAQAPHLVLATAFDTAPLLQALAIAGPGVYLPLNPLRGQISYGRLVDLPEPTLDALPPFPVNGHGSFISGVRQDGQACWFVGSTFERDCTLAPIRSEDHAANQTRLNTLLPHFAEPMAPAFAPEAVQAWAGLRCTLPDRLPAAGPVDAARWPGLSVCTGMGARGLSLSVLCADLLTASLQGQPLPLPPELAKHLLAERFLGKKPL